MRTRGVLECWFDFASNYSYPAVMRVEALTAARGVALRWRPFLLGPVFKAMGREDSPLFAYEAKGRYVWRDMERRCRLHGLAFRRPGVFPRRALLPMRIATLGVEQPWIGAFCRGAMRLNFVHDREIDDADAMRALLAELALPADELLAAAMADANKAALRARTDEALARGIFGAPMLLADGEMFWGDDRLEEAVAWAAEGVGDAHPP
ncbi:2-hydroxychromene-2-carboxylate isomerase [Luteimonas sp. SDU82]|uniref:2-hydroxychromene-2-carboxylate isomerase n=1 Tax=Luteimonas sp. SDU82 TaxID=3422592 RepID=UPI003EB9638F